LEEFLKYTLILLNKLLGENLFGLH
jgi:hypothetical protein